MPNENISALSALKKLVSAAFNLISARDATKREKDRITDALLLLSSDKTIHPESVAVIRDFYGKKDCNREIFFQILFSLPPEKIEYILNQIYAAEGDPRWLIRLRADLTVSMKKARAAGDAHAEALKTLGNIFTRYFLKIFNFQYLTTRCCNASNTSITLLKFISGKEGVHPADHWWEFESRLNSDDRIILSLEHFAMPYSPLVYVEVALSRGLIRTIHHIIGEQRRHVKLHEADSAIFYSLNTTRDGLNKIGLGAKMILRARDYIEQRFPQITRFATLSPLPRFRSYLDTVLGGGTHSFSLTVKKIDANRKGRFMSAEEKRKLRAELLKHGRVERDVSLSGLLKAALAEKEWWKRRYYRKALKGPLTAFARYYLEKEKRASSSRADAAPRAYDPVTNFHLSNGAYVGGINYCANTTLRGIQESYGMMVNYIYEGRTLVENKRAYKGGRVMVKV